MVLNKHLNYDICDEINKLVVNSTIQELQDDNIKLEIKVDDLETDVENLNDEYVELENDNYNLEQTQEVSITNIIACMNSEESNEPNRFEIFTEMTYDKGINYDIAETYDNFTDWYGDALNYYINYVIYGDGTYNVSLSQIYQVKRELGGDFELDFDNFTETQISKQVVFHLIKMRIDEQVSNNAIQIKVTMEDWYNEKIEEEEEEEQNERMKDAEMEENERRKEEAEMNAYERRRVMDTYEKCMEEIGE